MHVLQTNLKKENHMIAIAIGKHIDTDSVIHLYLKRPGQFKWQRFENYFNASKCIYYVYF